MPSEDSLYASSKGHDIKLILLMKLLTLSNPELVCFDDISRSEEYFLRLSLCELRNVDCSGSQ